MEHKQSFFQRIGKDKRYIVFNLFFAYFTLGVALIMLGSVLPVLKADYALNYQVGGMLLSVQSIGYAVAGLGAGFLPLYLGLKKSFILLTSGTCIGKRQSGLAADCNGSDRHQQGRRHQLQ